MMKRLFILLFSLLPILLQGQESSLYSFLTRIPGAEVTKVDSTRFMECYILMLPQQVDHADPDSRLFRQRIIVGHRGFDRPMVMVTEGYGSDYVNGYTCEEPTTLLNANQLYVEHRFFGPSTPDPVEWKYLNAEQDAGDYHYIRRLFGEIYKGKWIATGVSKGGQTAMEYKVYYPGDVDVTIPYVAPFNYRMLDKRIDRHFSKVGTASCRKSLKEMQKYFLVNKSVLLPKYEDICRKAGFTFNLMEPAKAYDYSVLELPFSFWQYTADCRALPQAGQFEPEKMVYSLVRLVSPYWYTDAVNAIRPAHYQFYSQLGYYEYNERPFRKYLKYKDYPNSDFVPEGVEVKWDGSYIKKLKSVIREKPQRMIFIYGGADPWGATSAGIKPGSGSLKMVLEGGTHMANIASLGREQKNEVAKALSVWLEMPVEIE